MKSGRTSHPGAVGLVALVVVGSLVGCGDDEIGRRYPVSGSVQYKGQPVAHGRISFIPAKGGEGRAAAGEIQDGRYALTTVTPDDGALPGSYRVSLMAKEIDLTQVKANQKGGSARPSDVIKANKAAKNLIPVKYASPETSGQTAQVKEGPNTIDFDLTD
ncbi:MAG TPA: hypothetical protein VFF52_10980 [Isosphaeraceae bacterium]|nr:hypothetical protein [Isosphaeraceae bacterium]